MGFMHTLLAGLVIAFLFATALFFLALKKKDNSIADEAWGLSFILVAWGTLVLSGSHTPRQIMACVLILIWGLRLSVRITLRNRGKGEDIRYRKWREEWGRSFVIRSYLQVFLLQAALMLCNITPVLFINTYDTGTIGWLYQEPRQSRQDHGPGPLALFTASQLLRRSHHVVGHLCSGAVRAVGLDIRDRAAHDHLSNPVRFRRSHD